MDDYVIIGEIVNTHGLRGELKVLPLTDEPKRFDELKEIHIKENGRSKKISKYKIDGVKYFKNFVILKLQGIDNANDALLLKRSSIIIDRKDAIVPKQNSYFIFDLIGLEVYDEDEQFLGIITDVIQTGSNDCYNVKKKDGTEYFIPALKSVVSDVNISLKKMTVKLPKGLINE